MEQEVLDPRGALTPAEIGTLLLRPSAARKTEKGSIRRRLLVAGLGFCGTCARAGRPAVHEQSEMRSMRRRGRLTFTICRSCQRADKATRKATHPGRAKHAAQNRLRRARQGAAPRRQQTGTAGYVYILTHPRFPGMAKVGRARSPVKRLRLYQAGCPERAYRMLWTLRVADYCDVELRLHKALATSARRLGGEWFDFQGADPVAAVSSLLTHTHVVRPRRAVSSPYTPEVHLGGAT